MSQAAPLFAFAPYVGQSAAFRGLLRDFASGTPFRSASVDELILEGDFYRRPLRPEDLEFLKFEKPVRADTVSRLPSLATHRTLNALYELSAATPPKTANASRMAQFTEFASERNRVFAAQLAPFLEAYAFDYLGKAQSEKDDAPLSASCLRELYSQDYQFWHRLFAELATNGYLQEGLRFILIQRWCLAPAGRGVLSQTVARGHFEGWPAEAVPRLESSLLGDDVLRQLATTLGVERQAHSYWQFYLATSLARSNLLYALARRTDQAFALYGALFAAQTEWLALEAAVARYCPHLYDSRVPATDPEQHLVQLQGRFEAALQFVHLQRGNGVVAQLKQGFAAAALIADRCRWDLGEQLTWLSNIERYRDLARAISQRIDTECPGIDRETFVEPRDMCSTTHVHNDHRLVTIQEGVMHFWGNVGMRLEMRKGDTLFVPEGRLHGSTVLSPECTYHQPIIPNAWIDELLGASQSKARRASA